MKRLFVDTNVIIDLLGQRKEYYESCQDFFTYAQDEKITLVVSALSFANIHYILSEQLKMNKIRNVLRKFKVLVIVAAFDDKILELSLENEFKDFEDGIQYFTAIEQKCEAIITRNKKDFKNSAIPILNTFEFLKLVE
jgi:predicted nucleic acid-binding protein